jgi:hypothetical protein
MKNTKETKTYTSFEDLAKAVATEFAKDMKEIGFDTFNEMAKSYDWTSKDIKEEVDGILRQITKGEAYVDECDGTEVMYKDTSMNYKRFNTMFRRYLKTDNLFDDEEE